MLTCKRVCWRLCSETKSKGPSSLLRLVAYVSTRLDLQQASEKPILTRSPPRRNSTITPTILTLLPRVRRRANYEPGVKLKHDCIGIVCGQCAKLAVRQIRKNVDCVWDRD